MRTILATLACCFIIWLNDANAQVFTARQGLAFFPGHKDIQVSIRDSVLRYELFNHWYSGSYVTLRDIKIPLSGIRKFNIDHDSLKIIIKKNKITLADRKYRIFKNVRHTSLCLSAEKMRKISYAYRISAQNNIGHLSLFNPDDLALNEFDFQQKVLKNLDERKAKTP